MLLLKIGALLLGLIMTGFFLLVLFCIHVGDFGPDEKIEFSLGVAPFLTALIVNQILVLCSSTSWVYRARKIVVLIELILVFAITFYSALQQDNLLELLPVAYLLTIGLQLLAIYKAKPKSALNTTEGDSAKD